MKSIYFSEVTDIGSLLQSIAYSTLFVLVDNNTKTHCYPIISENLPPHKVIEISAGETYKNLQTCNDIWNTLTENNADRNTLLINLGGGVITDMGGFCAATYKRGINFLNIPTTLLAQVDASVGGKTGVDFQQYKNHIGLFANAEAVLIDPIFHDTLDERQLKSGYAEMLKHGLIADKSHWTKCVDNKIEHIDHQLIKESVAIKEYIVNQDPNEKGLRKILNFGHTIGHAVESYLLNTKEELLHGEAIAYGMLAEAFISNQLGLLKQSELEEINRVINSYYKLPEIEKASYSEISRLCKQDKKNENNSINMSLLKQIGKACYNCSVDEKLIHLALENTL